MSVNFIKQMSSDLNIKRGKYRKERKAVVYDNPYKSIFAIFD